MPTYTQAFGSYKLALRLTLTELVQTEADIAANQTRVQWLYELYETLDYGSYSSNLTTCYLDLNGVRVNTVTNFTHDFRASGANSKTIGSGIYTCPHNNDGTKTMAFTAVYNSTSIGGMGKGTISGSLGLTTIPRGHTFTFPSSFTISTGNIPITITKNVSSWTSHITAYIGSTYIGEWSISGAGAQNITLDATHVSRAFGALPSSVSGTMTFTCRTRSGSTNVFSVAKTSTGTVPSSVKPVISSISASEANTVISSTLGLDYFVAGISKIKGTSTGVSGGAGTSNVTYAWTLETQTATTASPTFAAINKTSLSLKLTVTDTRGRTASKTLAVTQTAYTKPSISKFEAKRYNANNQDQVNFGLQASMTKLNMSGVNKNTIRYKIDIKKITDTEWTAHKTYSSYQVDNINLSATTMADITNDAKYHILATVQDRIGNSSTHQFVLNSSSKLWMEVTNGEVIKALVDFEASGKKVHGVTDVSSEFTIVGSGVSTLTAFRTGQVAVVRFKYTPPSGGYKTGMITSTLPATQLTSGSAYPDSSVDMTKPVIPYIGTSGTIALVATASSGAHNCSITYIIQEGY